MRPLTSLWERMGFFSRLISASFLATGVGLIVATFFSANLAKQEAHKELEVRFQEQISLLSDAVADSVQSERYGRIKPMLKEYLQLSSVKSAGFHSATEALQLESDVPLTQTAPDWFVWLCALEDRQGSRQIEINGHKVGEVTLTLSPLPIINRTWAFLVRQMLVMVGGAAIVVFGVGLALRANIKPFAVLLAGSRAFGRSDFARRMPLVGSREFRVTINAFNTMADDLERLVDAVSDSQRLYSVLVETAPVGVYRADLEGKLTYVNPALRALAGVADASLDNERWYLHIHPEDRERAIAFLMQVVSSGLAELASYRYLLPDGVVVWVKTQLAPIMDNAGQPVGFVGTVTDITAEKALGSRAERLSGLYEILSKVNYAIVHQSSESDLYPAICNALVAKKWFLGATISTIDESRRRARLVAQAGAWGEDAPRLIPDVELSDPDAPALLTATLRTGEMLIANDVQNDERVRPRFLESIRQRGMMASCTVPLKLKDETVAVLVLASGEKGFFSPDIVALIEEVGRDVSFALENFAREEQRRQAEQSLARNEENLRVTLHSIGDAVLVTDTEGRVTMMNPVAEALTGWSDSAARGRPAGEVFHIINEQTRKLVESPIDMVLREGKIVGLANHTVLIAKDGTERPIADSGAPIRYSTGGDINGVVLVFRDQSEEYRMLKALRASERLYSQLVGSAPVGIFQTDAAGQMIFANDVLLEIAGVTRDDMSPARWAAAYHPDDRERVGRAWAEAMQNLAPAEVTTYRYVRPDGSETWAQARAIPLLDEQGTLNGYVGVVTDITIEREQFLRIERISRLYATLSKINSVITHTIDRDSLYKEVCRIIVESGGFGSAAISHVDWESRRSWPVTTSGAWIADYKTQLPETDLDDPNWMTVSRMAMFAGVQVTVNDISVEDRIPLRLRELALSRGGIASSAVPLWTSGEVIGVLSLASSERGFFSEDIIRLIDDIGRDVSFALENIERAEKKRLAEEALLRSEQNLNVTLRSIGDAVLVTDTEGRVTMMNPIAEALTGWNETDARGRPAGEVFNIINEETRRSAESPIDMVLREGKIVGLANHTVLIAKDGVERPIADSGAPIRYDEEGEVRGVVLVFRDQSDEYRMLKALRESERLYSDLVKTAPVGVFITDIEGNTTYGNATMQSLAGLSKHVVTPQEWALTVHPDDRAYIAEKWRETLASRSSVTVSYRYLHADGRIIWVLTSLTPVLNDDKVFTGFIGAAVDTTGEQKHLLEIETLSRLYETLSQVSAAIVRSPDEKTLYDAVCAIMVGKGGFSRAGVTCPDWDRRKTILVSEAATGNVALNVDYFELDMSGPQSRNLTTLTLLSGSAETANDIPNDDRIGEVFQPLLEQIGARSASAVPFSRFGEVASVLTLTSSAKEFFSEDILRLIDEIARDVSHALENIESEKKRKQAEVKLADNEERLRMGLEVTKTGMYEIDFRKGHITLDRISAQLMGFGDEIIDVDFDRFNSMLPEEAREQIDIPIVIQELFREEYEDFSLETPIHLPDGNKRWLRSYGALTTERSDEGKPLRLLGVISDVTTARKLEEQDRLAATVFEKSGEAIMVLDASNKVAMVNQAFARMSGFDTKEAIGLDAEVFRAVQHDDDFYKVGTEILFRDDVWVGELWRRRKNGQEYPVLMTISIIRDKNGQVSHFVVLESDISKQKEFEQRISQLAYRDALTDLPNRTLLRDRVEQSIAIAHRENSTVALLFLDLDHFKNINDSLGHAVGDRLLIEMAQRLTGSIREMDTVGRLGGDEFLVVLPDAEAENAAHVAQKLLEESARPFIFESHSLTVTPSIGIALYPKDGSNFDELLKTADTAMYRAKDEGRNGYRFYTPEMNQAVFQRMVLESSMRRAIENKEFVLHYQPKFELSQHRLVGVEALIRWHQPEMGMVSPAHFIPVAEESGLIEPIGTWVLEEACRQCRVWRDEGLPPLRVAVNLSARQLAARNVIDLITNILQQSGLPGNGLEMEITESLLATDTEHILEVLQSLKALGVYVAVDDFGTGYSSLSYLKRFPIDRLKIDQSFVRDLVTDADDRAIATAVVTLGHSLGILVIAEGVETKKQMEILRDMGCDEVQGYYFGRPIPADEMTLMLRELAAKPSREA